ncbi:MAG: DNA polymerase III subunit delta' [Myxococcales bacterium]|nr:DNA polymerase III subunit delta' [Myxococcales bacterium]
MPLREVEGQAQPVEALRRALLGRRLHHAYLFAGPDGVGKALCAQGFAEALLCATPRDDGDACGACNPCRRTAERQHPDLHIVARREKKAGELERQIRIEQVRELQRALSFKSFEGARRVVLLLEAEKMNPATANALLKTLEEPGPDTHFILVTAAPHTLLPTVISRCQRVRFAPLPRALVATKLVELGDLTPAAADLLAGLAEGSIGKGLNLMRSDVLDRRQVILARADDPEGLDKVPELLDFADELARPEQRGTLPLVFHLLRTWYRDLLLVLTGLPYEALVHRDLAARARQRAAGLDVDAVLGRLSLLNRTEEAIFDRNANARLSIEAMLLHLAGVEAT